MSTINAIFAQSELGHIGRKGNHPLLWKLPGDLPRFKKLTENGVLIMGRHTFESLPGLLPDRMHYVITRDPDAYIGKGKYDSPFVTVVDSLNHAVLTARYWNPNAPLWIIGGADIINRGLCMCDRVYRTKVIERESDIPVHERAVVDLPGMDPYWGRFQLVSAVPSEAGTHIDEVYESRRTTLQIYGSGS